MADVATSDEPSFVGGQPPHLRSAPANILPQEEIKLPESQLRREGRSPEESTTSDKVCLRRSRRVADVVTSDEPSFAGGQPAHPHPAPANIRSQEENHYRQPQLRRETRSPEEGTRSFKGYPRRSRRAADVATSYEPSFVGGQHPHPRAQLRQAFSHRRKIITGNRNSGEKDTHRKTLVTTNR